jgi:hypothetical protein
VDARDKPGHDESIYRIYLTVHSAGLAAAAAAARAFSAAAFFSTIFTAQIDPP